MSIDTSAIAHLEEKIENILQRIGRLQAENEDLKHKIVESEKWRLELESKEKELNDLKELLALQDAERVEIRSRVEALLTKLEG
jgi:cell shape-determining protein MreC